MSGLCIPVAPLVSSTDVDHTRLGNDTRLRLGQMTEIRGYRINDVGPKGRSYRRAGHNARVVLPDPLAPPTLYGRVRESRVLEGLLGAARERGDALVLVGEPGIGKSSLIAAAAANARASGFQILTATGVQSEAEIPFAGLHQLTLALQGRSTLCRARSGRQCWRRSAGRASLRLTVF